MNKGLIFVFFSHKKNMVEPRMSHTDCFNNVLTTFLGLERVSCVAVYAGSEHSEISFENVIICALNIKKGLTGLERHEGE